ncbi:acyltransferase domain-containing protein [Massilia sp. PAMC28688]|uniref:acyltransferase domain-containing protein n=1 Tax=Massilia sp. PAMC28688 TaxID=2861283 RepID=UPI001E51AD94|nr:acyltransferase domain-containing protein [Massilia sp. PAMC28688]
MKTVFMFSGQGSQYYQMGKALFDQQPVFRRHMEQLDTCVHALCGHSVLATLYAPGNQMGSAFDRTLLSHPAIIMVEYALARTLIEAGIEPDVVLGASLGSYTAAAVAGALPVSEALALAVAHARSLEQCSAPGGMIAILDDPQLMQEDFLRLHASCGGVNFASHFVVSAPAAQCLQIEAELRARDIAHQRIPVSFAFHSDGIDNARASFEVRTEGIRAGRARLPIMCCEQARLLTELPPGYFWDVTRQPIRFPDAIAALERAGHYRYLDVGPAGTLAVFLKYLLAPGSASTCHTILTPYGRDTANFDRLMAVC